ncbi:MAG: hypothetical protein J7M39_06360 [Anaerolineae bacterium]|nr:hypothetical protein [Anaerolineae bacterium]
MAKHLQPSAAVFREAYTDEAWLTARVPGSVDADLQAEPGVRRLVEAF